MAQHLMAGRAQRLEARQEQLRALLGLDDRQSGKVQALLNECFPAIHDPAAFALLTEEERQEVGIPAEQVFAGHLGVESEKQFAEALAGFLSPEQTERFQQAAAESRTNAVEAAVYRELAALQTQMPLTPEQKDASFAALSHLAQREHDGLEPNAGIFAARRQQRLEAMRAILSAEQLTAYEKSISGTSFSATVQLLTNRMPPA